MIHAASRAALAQLQDDLSAVIRTDADLQTVAGELYSVNRLLETQPRLRRALADPATPAQARTQLAQGLLTGKISPTAVQVVVNAVTKRWSNPWDLTDALSISGDTLLLGAADKAGQLDEVEDQLFRFGRIVRGQDDLRSLLDERAVEPDRRAALLDSVLQGKADPITVALLDQGVRNDRKRTIELAVDDLLELTAQLRGQSMADVTSAVPLTDDQEQRLGAVLSRMYGRTITVRTQVDARVQGGLVVRIGNDLIDGSIAHRLATVKTELAG